MTPSDSWVNKWIIDFKKHKNWGIDMEKEIKQLEELCHNLFIDNEEIHIQYDKIIYEIAKKHEPEIINELDKLIKDINFWYA